MKKHTILWADDDTDDLMMIRDVLGLNANEHEIVEVYNGKEVLNYLNIAKANQDLPCLIILDMNMPIMNGKDTLVHLKNKEEYKDIPIVIFTTSNSELDRMFCKKYDVEMITKPPEYMALHNIVHRILDMCEVTKTPH